MSEKQIEIGELEKAVANVGGVFATKDVSEQRELRAAHGLLASHRNWHAFIGRALSMNHGALGIENTGCSSKKRGARWSKRVGSPRAAASLVAPRIEAASRGSREHEEELGPQCARDDRFTGRMRLHQSWWRAYELRTPCGTGPMASSTTRYGSMLDAQAGDAGKNFLTEQIFAVARRRLAEGAGAVEPFRLCRNLLSSQPMCFNLFAPLVDDLERATRLVRSLIGDEVARVHRVAVEWAPTPAEAYLADRTAFDAFIDYERTDGSRVALGIETKLTDTFSQKPYDGPAYRRWMDRAGSSPFREEAWGDLSAPRHNQLWRNHLLVIALRDPDGSPFAAVRSAVVRHPLDESGAAVIASYRRLLRDGDDTFVSWTLDDVALAFEHAAEPSERPWLEAFRTRYLDLDRSAPYWRR